MNITGQDHDAEHERLMQQLGAYVDDELSPEEAAVLEAHLLGCARCRQELSLQRQLRARLEQQGIERAPAGLRARIQSRLEDEAPAAAANKRQWRARFRPPAWAGWAAAACLVLLIGLYTGLRPEPAPQPIPMIADALANYHHRLAGGLSGTGEVSLAQLDRSLPYPVRPIAGLKDRLLDVWRLRISGQPAAALAYRLGNQVIVQYVVSDRVFFRQPLVRKAVRAHGVYVVSAGRASVVAWPGTRNGSLVVGSVSVSRLKSLHAQEKML